MISMRRDRCAGPSFRPPRVDPGGMCVLVIAYLIHEELTRTAGRPAIARLRHGGEEERVAACQALGQLHGEESGAAVPELVAASGDPVARPPRGHRRPHADRPRSGAVLSALVDAVEDEDAGVRTRAVLALGMLRMDTPSVTAALRPPSWTWTPKSVRRPRRPWA